MSLGIIGRKLGMTQIFDEEGNVIPVTVVSAGPCQILEIKDRAKHGYSALKVGFEEDAKNVSKPQAGYYQAISKVAGKTITPKKLVKEFRLDDASAYNVGDVLNVELFETGEKVDVAGKSKGKGFQGVIKRHNFGGGRATHGSHFHRAPGSIGAHTYPARVWPGQKMPGHMGSENVTVRNLKVFKVDQENNLLLIKGAIPGPAKSLVIIKKKK